MVISVLITVASNRSGPVRGLILAATRGLRQDMARMEARLREDMKQLAEHVAR